MSSESDRSEQEREAARLERERKRAAERGESAPAAPPPRDLPPQVPPLASGAPKLDQPGGDKPASEAPRPAPAAPARPQQPATAPPAAPPAPPRKVTDDEDERPIGTVRPGAATAVPPAQPQARRRSPGRHALLFGLAAVVVIAIAFFANGIFEPFKGDGSGSVSVHIPTGVSAGEVGKILAAKGVISSPFFFELRATLGGDRANLRAGTYTLSEGMSNGAALAVLTNVTKAAAVISVLIPEGPSRQEVAPIVARQGVTGNYVAASRVSPLLNPRSYGAPSSVKSLEGFLFPATYEMLKSKPTATSLVGKQLVAFKQNLAKIDFSYAKSKNLSVYDVVTLASIIEREALFDADRPMVAAVFYNRLHKSISLGSDATTRFAVSNWNKPLTVSQLANGSKYNTRRFSGLPPGPIGNPGLASLRAAAHPPKSANLFFIVTPCQKGRLSFATTDAQFQKLINAYDSRRASQGGKDPAFCR